MLRAAYILMPVTPRSLAGRHYLRSNVASLYALSRHDGLHVDVPIKFFIL